MIANDEHQLRCPRRRADSASARRDTRGAVDEQVAPRDERLVVRVRRSREHAEADRDRERTELELVVRPSTRPHQREQDDVADRRLAGEQHRRRSMPMPSPAVGGMPTSSARQ